MTAKRSHIFVDTADRQITATQFTLMMGAICMFTLEKKQPLKGFEIVSIRNFSGRFGWTYEALSPATCKDIVDTPASKLEFQVMTKSHTLFESERKPL